MDTVITGGSADALAKALKTIRDQPGKVWPVWQASGGWPARKGGSRPSSRLSNRLLWSLESDRLLHGAGSQRPRHAARAASHGCATPWLAFWLHHGRGFIHTAAARLSLVACPTRPAPQFGQMHSEDGFGVRWVPNPDFVSPCDGEACAWL